MKPLKRILIALISVFLTFFIINIQLVSAASFPDLETKIIAESSTSKIIKLQTFLKELDLYSGNIDGVHANVLPSVLSYQKQTGLISNNSDYGAGYFWVKTLTSLQEDYPEKFEKHKSILEQDAPVEWERNFHVTAYYSAIPWQDRYSYSSSLGRYRTYAEAIRMQWRWTNGASWKEVFPWMLAWPRNYDFGTKIQLEGIWIWAIEDRWSAIVNAGERWFENDRIDIWMWFWDAWRLRAEKWWTRTVKWKIVSDDVEVNIAFNESVINLYNNLYVTPESNSVDIEKLQKLFTQLDLYTWNIDGKYISIKDNLIDFQVKYNIISSKYDEQAGYFWKKTIAAIKSKYTVDDNIFKVPEIDISLQFDALTRKEKLAIVRFSVRLNNYITKQSKGNKIKITQQKTALQNKIQKVIDKTHNNKKKKHTLQYLKILIK